MKNKVKIIAEAGINHNGSFNKALNLIKIAKKSNADFVKFQLFKTESFINKSFKNNKINYKIVFKRFKSLEFSLSEWKKIINFGKKIGIKVFFSIFDIESLKTIKVLKIKLIKIPSGEINNYPLLKEVNNLKFHVILSTGMSSLHEIKKAIKILKKCKITLLHCVSEYPTVKPNLKNISNLKKVFNLQTGFSDHTNDIFTPALSVIAGATIIEKHFTYNKKQKIGDHKFSLSPKDLKLMIENVRLAERSLGNSERKITKKEKNLKFYARKGLYLNKNKQKGEKVNIKDFDVLRPEGYLSIDKLNLIKNKKILMNLKKHQILKRQYFK